MANAAGSRTHKSAKRKKADKGRERMVAAEVHKKEKKRAKRGRAGTPGLCQARTANGQKYNQKARTADCTKKHR